MLVTEVPLRHALVEWLRSASVDHIFGNPGSSEVPLLDALVPVARPAYVLVAHEAAAISAADAYAQLSRRPAVVSVHVTPGVANILGGLFLARSHRSPVVVIAGQQDSRILDRRPFLSSDLVDTVRQHVKWAYQVEHAADVLPALRRAFEIAATVPAGPAFVAVPRDLYDHEVARIGPPAPPTELPVPDERALDRAASIIASARTPILLSGNEVGARGAAAIEAVVAFAEAIGARVYSEHNATNMHFPSAHPQYLGGNAHGTAPVKEWLEPADVLIAVGSDLFMEERYHAEPLVRAGCRIVQIDEDAAEIGRLFPVAAGLAGDLPRTLLALTSRVRSALGPRRTAVAARREEVRALRAALDDERERVRQAVGDRRPIRMPRIYAELRAALPDDAVMVDEAVNMASYLHDFFEFRVPDTLLSSKQSWLGWGVGASVGAQLARPSQRVVAVLGDGSATYGIQGLWTAMRHALPIVTLILNNGGYMAVQNHLREYGGDAAAARRYPGTDLSGIDFVSLGRGFGIVGERVSEPAAIGPALRAALASGEPRVLEIVIDPDDAGFRRAPIPRLSSAERGEHILREEA